MSSVMDNNYRVKLRMRSLLSRQPLVRVLDNESGTSGLPIDQEEASDWSDGGFLLAELRASYWPKRGPLIGRSEGFLLAEVRASYWPE